MEIENPQLISDLFFMLNASQDISQNFNQFQLQNSTNKSKKNKLLENINLSTEVKNLKQSLSNFEENYGYNSPYHDDIINKKKEKKVSKKLSIEISQKIYELYLKKYYNDCYDLWNIFELKPLLNISAKENFEMLRHLTKVRDEYLERKNILNNLDKFNYFDDHNYQFETGINFESNKNDNIKNIIKIPRIKLIIQLISKKNKSIIFEVLENLEKGDYGSEVITIKDFFNN